jgi:tetratricopeptide (TPR) repeat protein
MLLLLLGCGGPQVRRVPAAVHEHLLAEINGLRRENNLLPLAFDDVMNAEALGRAREVASTGELQPDNNRLPVLVKAGVFARFALSHEMSAASLSDVAPSITSDPISKSKLLHPRITHLGFGFEKAGGKVFVVLDLARVVPRIADEQARAHIARQLEQKRVRNSVEPLAIKDNLSDLAQRIASGYVTGKGTSDELIREVQTEMRAATFAMGRATINFQVASDLDAVLIPERTSDPSLAFVGLGYAQGNHPSHEPGAMAVVILLAEPRTGHNASRDVADLPPPKLANRLHGKSTKTPTEEAWTATLTGNHRKAAKLFEKAYRKHRKPILIYEAARAHARNGDAKKALHDMRLFANSATGEDKQKALAMIEHLEKGETIFTASKQEKMSTEAKRFFLIGKTLYEQEEWDGAVDAFQQAYRYSPHGEIIYNIGLAHLKAGRIGEALNFFGEYQRQVPEATNVDEAKQFFEIGLELYRTGQFEAAGRHFAMAYSFLPFPELVYNLGLCHKALGENKKAIRFFREFLINDLPIEDRQEVEAMIQELKSADNGIQ